MSQALLAIQNILQNSNIFNRSRQTILFTPFSDKKVTQFSDFLLSSVSYVKVSILRLQTAGTCCPLRFPNHSKLSFNRFGADLHKYPFLRIDSYAKDGRSEGV